MPDKNGKKDSNAEELFHILNEYRAEYDALKEDETPKSRFVPEKDPEENVKPAWAHHFEDRLSETETDAEEEMRGEEKENLPAKRDISVHFTDFSGDDGGESHTVTDGSDGVFHREPGEDDPRDAATDGAQKAKAAPEEKEKPFVLRALFAAGNFFWNCGFVAKAAVYVAIVGILSAFLSYYIITVGNDVFAFVKNEKECTVNIEEGMTRKEVAYLLQKKGVIEYSWAFNLFMIYRGDENDSFLPGEHSLSSSMNYNQIINELTMETYNLVQVSVTIPEGYTTDQIIDLFVASGIGKREAFVDAINNYPYKHEFVRLLDQNGYPEDRVYRLEGYLYPDTYFFYQDSKEYLVINKLLNNFNNRVWAYYESTFKKDIDAFGFSFDDVITLASMVQSEARHFIDYECISYVFHNRLKSSAPEFKWLQSDATIQYFLPEHVENLTREHLDTDNPYNTYLYTGLPPGAISNPGFDAISAAIYPDAPLDGNGEPMNAYFFVSNKAGRTYYALTDKEHRANKARVEKENAEMEDESG